MNVTSDYLWQHIFSPNSSMLLVGDNSLRKNRLQNSYGKRKIVFYAPGIERDDIRVELYQEKILSVELDYSKQSEEVCRDVLSLLCAKRATMVGLPGCDFKDGKIFVQESLGDGRFSIKASFRNGILTIETEPSEELKKSVSISVSD